MTDSPVDNPAVARRQLGFLETFDKKYEGFRRELERLERVAGGGSPAASGWPTDGLERIARSLVGAGAVYSLPTVTNWARSFLERLDRIRGVSAPPSREDFAWLAEQIGVLTDIEAGLTRAAREVVSPATTIPPDEPGGEPPRPAVRVSNSPPPFIAPSAATDRKEEAPRRATPLPPRRSSVPPPAPPRRSNAPPPVLPRRSSVPPPLPALPVPPEPIRVATPVPPEPDADATVPVPSVPPPAPPPARAPDQGRTSTPPGQAIPEPLASFAAPELPDERLVSRGWQVLALVALIALGFSLWFNYRLFASFTDDPPRASRAGAAASDSAATLEEPPALLPDLRRLLDSGPAEEEPAAAKAEPEALSSPEPAEAPEPAAADGYRRGERGQPNAAGTAVTRDDDEETEEQRARRKRRKAAAEAAAAGSTPGSGSPSANPYGD
jgi:hypothetical protein